MVAIYSVILAGGSGSRLWPLSRDSYPKQILNFDYEESLFFNTFLRVTTVCDDKHIITTTNIKHASAIREQLAKLKDKFSRTADYKLLTEPISKNTSSSIAMAVKYIEQQQIYNIDKTIVIVFPSDHIIPNREEFSSFIERGIKLAQEGYIVAFSKETDIVDENFGYLKTRNSSKLREIEPSALNVVKFIEKPALKVQKSEFSKGNFCVNTGIYMFSIETFYAELKKYAFDLYKSIENIEVKDTMPSIPLQEFEEFTSISIDYSIMENTKKLVTIPFRSEWKDIGSWDAVYELSNKDSKGNCFHGKVVDLNSENSLVYSTSKLVATVGLKDKVVVETEDAILVCDKNNTNAIKNIYKKLNGHNSAAKEIHKTVYRPWGYYTVLEDGNGFLTKCIVVNPHSKLSVQLHHHRSEHWIVLEGVATVLKGDKFNTLHSGDSIDIAIEEVHSLQNLTDEQIKILEIQQGDILDENDIERLEDIYGRA